MKYLEFGTEHPELMVILHGGGICYRAADIVHSDVLGEYIRDGAALGTFDFDALAPDIAHGTVGDDHLRNLPYRLQPDADARADRGERTVGDMHILHGTAAGLQAKVTLVSSAVVPGVTAYCIIGIQLFGNWRLVFGIGSNASGAGRVLCAAVRRTGAVCRQGKAGIERLTGQRACDGMAADMPLGTKGDFGYHLHAGQRGPDGTQTVCGHRPAFRPALYPDMAEIPKAQHRVRRGLLKRSLAEGCAERIA